ncbi:hypothetical protein GGE07_005899 [Sinorhizobium terangae]|nr:hypothetical protein [Sinorhizobium terangae]
MLARLQRVQMLLKTRLVGLLLLRACIVCAGEI